MSTSALAAPSADSDSAVWLDALRDTGPARDRAIAALHELLLRGARFEVARRSASLARVRGESFDDVAMQAADDALVAVLAKLDDFRGASRFTTWAYKFAILEAGVRVRKRAWQEREVVLDSDSWTRLAPSTRGPAEDAERGELLAAMSETIGDALTEHQRRVLVALAIDGVPIDVLAERLDTNRNALYKTLHDARRKLRSALAERGFAIGWEDS
ncbi:MAG TPA: sigma-70 family RNA polymerase sigma factor [Thermoleophilaceae bacterium]|nr:sigma-70 family RNA polymerase sigma factor [Thermoleophilaceae bacterium]